MKEKYYKYPRTPHLPWSEKASDDDKRLQDCSNFEGREVVVTVKLDGENTTMYNDKIHARSINSDNHPSRDWVKGYWSKIAHEIPKTIRICGENTYALHTIPYNNLKNYFYCFSIWHENKCLSWNETLEWCELLNLTPIPVLYYGIYDYDKIRNIYQSEYNGDPMEGYVIRLADEFDRNDFGISIAKYVSSNFQIDSEKHWMQGKVIPNKIKE